MLSVAYDFVLTFRVEIFVCRHESGGGWKLGACAPTSPATLHDWAAAELDMDRIHPWIGLDQDSQETMDRIGVGLVTLSHCLFFSYILLRYSHLKCALCLSSNHCSTVDNVSYELWFMNVQVGPVLV